RADIGSAVSGNVLRSRRPSSRGVSPGRLSAPANRASTSVRFQTAITLRGRRYLDRTTSSRRSRATRLPRILVAVDASRTDETRRDGQRAKHVAHGGGDELAVALMRREKEILDRVDAVRGPGVQRVREVARIAEVGLDRRRLVVRGGRPGVGHDLDREVVNL